MVFEASDYREHFERRDLDSQPVRVPGKSLLSLQLEQHKTASTNPFMEYAKYDGRVRSNITLCNYFV